MPHGSGEAYLPVLAALARLCEGPEGTDLLTQLDQYANMADADVVAPQLGGPGQLRRRSEGAWPERMRQELAMALDKFTERTPLVLVLEDLHWSDDATLTLLQVLAQRPGRARLLLLGTYCPAEVHASDHLKMIVEKLQRDRQCEELALEALAQRPWVHT